MSWEDGITPTYGAYIISVILKDILVSTTEETRYKNHKFYALLQVLKASTVDGGITEQDLRKALQAQGITVVPVPSVEPKGYKLAEKDDPDETCE